MLISIDLCDLVTLIFKWKDISFSITRSLQRVCCELALRRESTMIQFPFSTEGVLNFYSRLAEIVHPVQRIARLAWNDQ
jgi:hypothetical protein